MRTYIFTLTDTFGGEANFSWVKRFEGKFKSDNSAIRGASKHFNLQGLLKYQGNDIWLVRGACMMLTLDYVEEV